MLLQRERAVGNVSQAPKPIEQSVHPWISRANGLWPGLSGLRILAVLVVFLLTAILVAVVLGSRRRRRTLLIGIPVAVVLSWVVVDGASPIGQWFAADCTPLSPKGIPWSCPSSEVRGTADGRAWGSSRSPGRSIDRFPARS